MKSIADINIMEEVKGGSAVSSFCAGFAAGEVIYAVGVLANWWNPVGWIGGAAMVAIDAGCFVEATN